MIKRPMKGAPVADLSQVRLPCLAFPKIDGFRCLLADSALTSRLSPFPNREFHRATSGLLKPGRMLDGEVVVGKKFGKGVLQRTSSGLTSEAGDPDWTLWVFDSPLIDAGFEVRYDDACSRVDTLNHPRIRILKAKLIATLAELEAYQDECLTRGAEGIITRSLDGPYKEGKATLRQQWMLKSKPFDDAEGWITGYYEEHENTNDPKRDAIGKLKRSSAKAGKVPKGTLGGLLLRDRKTSVTVRVGGGFTAAQRRAFWDNRDLLLGKLVKYKKQRVGEKDKPRHPNFLEFVDFRPEWDMTD